VTDRSHNADSLAILLEASPDAVVAVDSHGIVVLASPAVKTLFGFDPEEIVGQAVELLVPEESGVAHRRHRAKYFDEATPRPMGLGLELIGRRRDGSLFPIDVSLAPFSSGDQVLVGAFVRDATERRRHETRLRAITEITQHLLVGEQTETTLELVARRARGLVDAQLGWVVVPTGNGELVISAADGEGASSVIGVRIEQAWTSGYRDLVPANLYNVDYSLLGTGRVEPLLRRIRNEMGSAGMWVESAKGECNLGQQEIAFRYTGLVTKADEHALFKMGAKEIASQEACSLTFMAKYDAREGNSCHIHVSLRDDSDQPVFSGDGNHGFSRVFEQFIAGLLATLRELTLFVAPNVNSYKRFVPGSFAPTALTWGHDNRSCALRVVGHHPAALRVECRVPGGDVNPYLALAAMVAGGMYGIEQGLVLEPEFEGNAYDSDKPRLPTTLKEAAGLFAASSVAREAFGDEVVDHYANMARVELEAFESTVTDWERYRGFERL
jgi:PAS domain S-box-containing protein